MTQDESDDLIIETIPVGPLACNCTIIGDPTTGQGIIVDPGWDAEKILSEVSRLGLEIVGAVHTHAHIDHINATLGVHERLGAPAELHEDDLFLYRAIDDQALMLRMWGLPVEPHRPPEPGRLIGEGDVVGKGRFAMEVLHTPGHTPGSLSFLLSGWKRPLLLSGDTLFQAGVGRTDLEGGDPLALKASIREKLYALPDETLVIPGHGPLTTIGDERRGNPFVRA